MRRLLTVAILTASAVFGQTGLLSIQNGSIDFAGASHTAPTIVVANVPGLPALCTPGELAVVTSATPGQMIYECGPVNTWTQQLNSGGTDAVKNNATNTGTAAMTLDMSASTAAAALRIPNQAGAAPTTAGAVSYDTTNKNIHAGANGVDNILPALPASGIPTTQNCVKWVVTTNTVTLGDFGAGCGATATQKARAVVGAFDGGGSALTTSAVAYIPVPFACTLSNFTIAVDTGTIDFDIWKVATGGTAIPTVANTIISGTSYLAISTGTKVGPSAIAGSLTTTAVAANDTFGIKVHAVSSATKATLMMQCDVS